MSNIEAMKQALEALERSVATCFDRYAHEQVMSRPEHFINQTITSLRQAIAEAEKQEPAIDPCKEGTCDCCWKHLDEQEPVAWYIREKDMMTRDANWVAEYPDMVEPLYTRPQPKREWIGLTDEEIKEIVGPWGDTPIKGYTRKLFDKIEARLKGKNHGNQ